MAFAAKSWSLDLCVWDLLIEIGMGLRFGISMYLFAPSSAHHSLVMIFLVRDTFVWIFGIN